MTQTPSGNMTATTTIEQTVRIDAPPELVWSFWTDPDRITEWWGTGTAFDVEPGGALRIELADGPVMCGTIEALEPPNRLVFTFGWEGNAPGEPLAPGSTVVEVTLTPDGDGTLLALRHSDMPLTHAADHERGWRLFVGERLVAAIAD